MGNSWVPAASGEAHGYAWEVIRISHECTVGETGWWHNGYVVVPEGHPWRSGEVDVEAEVDVHGGITGSRSETDFGFDCNHAWDLRFGETRD